MAAGKINLQANDTRIYEITAEDGAGSNVSVVVPKEGGVLASEGYAVAKSGDTMTGNLNFSGTGLRITGDFSNTGNLCFQTSVNNSYTVIQAVPNGSSTISAIRVFNSSSLDNCSFGDINISDTLFNIRAGVTGSGINLPMVFRTGANLERLRIDTSGNVLVTGSGGLGYGVGSGGTVTQATSKTTPVTLNKPTGTITMSNSALASGTKTSFYLNNSLIGNNDIVVAYPSAGSAYINQYEVRTRSGAGASEIIVSQTSGSTLSDAININFVLIKGALA